MSRISVLGLGYVGTVSAACFAELGHEVIGVDVSPLKVEMINRGQSPIVEELISELIADTVSSGRLRADGDVAEAIKNSDVSLICVGTPSSNGGGPDMMYVRRVAEEIGDALRDHSGYHVVVLRSTVLPGTLDDIVIPALAAHSGKTPGKDFGVCFHPEFLREGTSVKDFRDPPKIVIGSHDTKAADTLASYYEGFPAPLFKTAVRTAELLKYADNAFHALKVSFGNEIGTLCKELGIDSHELMHIFCQDTKLNISPAYLMPGFAYGGSCLPKDLRALNHLARTCHVELPVLNVVHRSNEQHLLRTVDMITRLEKRRIGMLGLSFKRGTDDLRESPLVELAERLLGKGYSVKIYDENVLLSRIRGGNKIYLDQKLPHLSEVLSDQMEAVISESDVIVVGASNPAFAHALTAAASEKIVVDLVRLFPNGVPRFAGYHGVCW
ncbi:MAG: UDP-glucose/GDP-mannose dehydrogenase family protein [Candidatus Hydrogenedentes bacterium]|nr:UDP-glucose/GDP-mannose dehydrogenase family protein [Candidatus Hydrogenedentota bacterium]